MSIQITINADTVDEALNEIRAMAGHIKGFGVGVTVREGDGGPVVAGPNIPGPEPVAGPNIPGPEPVAGPNIPGPEPEKPKKTRPSRKPTAEAAPVDTAEADAQDAADEAVETEAKRTAPVTRDDVRAAMVAYQQKYGTAETLKAGPKIIESVLGPIPAGTKTPDGKDAVFWTLSTIPEARLADVVGRFKEATDSGEFHEAGNG